MLFCDNCGRHTPGCSEIRSREVLIHGVSIPVRYKASICSHCGAELYDDEVEEYVMRIAREQFRSKRNMLPAARLKAYMTKNGLTAEQMAEKTGCAVAEIIAASRGVLLDTGVDDKLKRAVSA